MGKKVILRQTKGGQYIVTIPKQIAELKGLRKGTVAYWTEDSKGNLVLIKEEKFRKNE